MKIIRLDEVDSTNEYAKRIIQENNNNLILPVCIIANYQTKGKGRHGNVWLSKKGENLLCSYVSISEFDMITYNKLIAVITANVIKHLYPALRVSIKWPNDILVNSKKIAGILIEKIQSYYIAGVGVNINQRNFENLAFATSIYKETGQKANMLSIINEFGKITRIFEKVNKSFIHKLYDEMLWKYGEEVCVKGKNGKIKGKIIEVNYYGELVLQTNQGIKKYSNNNFKICMS